MTLGESISTCFSKYAAFEGRASRSEFWWWFLFTCLASAAAGIVSETLSGLFSLTVLLPSLAVGARRLRDTDRSAWYLLLWFIPGRVGDTGSQGAEPVLSGRAGRGLLAADTGPTATC